MKKKLPKKFIVGILVAGVVLGLVLSYTLVLTANGIETVNGYKASCVDLLDTTKSGADKNSALLEGMNKGIEKYQGTRIKLHNVVVYREINKTTFIASSSGVGIYGNFGQKIYTGKNAKKNYLVDMDTKAVSRFVVKGSFVRMHSLKEPGPYEDLQICDVYGVYEGTYTVKDTNGTETVLPVIKVVLIDRDPNK